MAGAAFGRAPAGNVPAMDDIDVERRERRFQRRTGRRLALGLGVGGVTGAVLGALAGSIVSDVGTPAMWASTVAGAIFFGGLGAVWSAMSGLENPRPGREPLTTDRPLRDVEEPTVEYPEEAEEGAEARRRELG
jgi:hypothetical protein